MDGREVQAGQYVYLDQNIIIYTRDEIRRGALSTPLFLTIFKLKGQGIIFPYSQAHLLDFFGDDSKATGQYVSTDLKILSKISSNYILGTAYEGQKLILLIGQRHPREVLLSNRLEDSLSVAAPQFAEFFVDMHQMNTEHPFYSMLVNNGWRFNPLMLEDYIRSLAEDADKLKLFNKSLRDNLRALGNVPQKLIDFWEMATKEENFIRSNYGEILKLHFELVGKQYNKSDMSQLPIAYWVLNQCTGFRDEIKKKSNLKNTNADGLHFFYAYKANYLVSADKEFVKKCRFLKDFFDLSFELVSMDEFLKM